MAAAFRCPCMQLRLRQAGAGVGRGTTWASPLAHWNLSDGCDVLSVRTLALYVCKTWAVVPVSAVRQSEVFRTGSAVLAVNRSCCSGWLKYCRFVVSAY